VARSERKLLVGMNSEMGSIARTDYGGYYPYRSSKAALNMVMKCLAMDLRKRGITAVALNPGWVQTDMGGAKAPLRPAESIHGMLQVLNRLGPKDTGKFFSYDGTELPW
jgi:NAD(P)-dependent dehydrogenase (short-subunit alcohol dehydrogenase family)